MTNYKHSKMCSEYIFKNNNTRKCHNNISIVINSKNFCWIHADKKYNKASIYIQKIYRAFYIRKKLKNIYYRLPDDIQGKICHYINQSIKYSRYTDCIKKFILLRYSNFIISTNPILYVDLTLYPQPIITNHLEILNSIITCYKLHIKYFDIIEYQYLEILYRRCRNYYLDNIYFNNLNENNPEFNGLVSQCKSIFIDYIMIFNK